MAKYNYFEALEQLSDLAEQAVRLVCGPPIPDGAAKLSALRRASDRAICGLEDALFSDFLPPLERDSIAACAHALSRVMDRASELLCAPLRPTTEEGAVCIKLAARLTQSVALLRRISKPKENPDRQGFRELAAQGRAAHGATLRSIHDGALPSSALRHAMLLGRLRTELSHAFDRLVEVMLNNI